LSLTLHLRNQDWWAAGELEENLPEVVAAAECTHLAFDVPDLWGDALFFNGFSVRYWLEKQTGRKDLVVYSPNEISQAGTLPEPACYFRFNQGQIAEVHPGKAKPFPSFTRGQNWAQR
jgi:hypothetical protein